MAVVVVVVVVVLIHCQQYSAVTHNETSTSLAAITWQLDDRLEAICLAVLSNDFWTRKLNWFSVHFLAEPGLAIFARGSGKRLVISCRGFMKFWESMAEAWLVWYKLIISHKSENTQLFLFYTSGDSDVISFHICASWLSLPFCE